MNLGLTIDWDHNTVVELEANYWSYGSPAITHKRAEHLALKQIDWINLQLVHHILYCTTQGLHQSHAL